MTPVPETHHKPPIPVLVDVAGVRFSVGVDQTTKEDLVVKGERTRVRCGSQIRESCPAEFEGGLWVRGR